MSFTKHELEQLADLIAARQPPLSPSATHSCQFTAEDLAAIKDMANMFRATKDSAKATGVRALQALMWFLLIAALAGVLSALGLVELRQLFRLR